MENTQENKMGVMPENRLLITMAAPIMLSMLVQALYNVVDSIFVSHISENALTAVSMAFPLQNIVISVAVGFGVGINALLSRALGQKNSARANNVAVQGLYLAGMSYLLVLIIGIFGAEAYMRTQTDITEIVEYGTVYLYICLCCSFGIFTEITFERFLQSTGRTLLSMVSQLIGAAFNIIMDPILIFGLWGFPRLGIFGAALATVIGQCLGAGVGILLNHFKNPEITLSYARPDWPLMREISKISIPSILMSCMMSVTNYTVNRILVRFSETAVAVFGAYFKLESFVFMPVFGLNNGMIPIVAYNYGAEKPARIHRVIRLSMLYASAFMLFGILVFTLIPEPLLSLFDASAQMLEIGIPALRIISLSFPLAGICIICSSTCQALGYSFFSMLIAFVRQLIVLLPVAMLLAKTGVLRNVWYSFPIAELASIVLSLVFLHTALKRTGMLHVPNS